MPKLGPEASIFSIDAKARGKAKSGVNCVSIPSLNPIISWPKSPAGNIKTKPLGQMVEAQTTCWDGENWQRTRMFRRHGCLIRNWPRLQFRGPNPSLSSSSATSCLYLFYRSVSQPGRVHKRAHITPSNPYQSLRRKSHGPPYPAPFPPLVLAEAQLYLPNSDF